VGISTAIVMSGETTEKNLKEIIIKPEVTFANIRELLNNIKE